MSVEDVSPSPRMHSPLNKSFSPNAAAIKAAEEEENKTYELNDPEELILDLKKHKTTLQEKIRGLNKEVETVQKEALKSIEDHDKEKTKKMILVKKALIKEKESCKNGISVCEKQISNIKKALDMAERTALFKEINDVMVELKSQLSIEKIHEVMGNLQQIDELNDEYMDMIKDFVGEENVDEELAALEKEVEQEEQKKLQTALPAAPTHSLPQVSEKTTTTESAEQASEEPVAELA